ncbi:GntR family transcriptional regulator [Streptomyces olivaceus]|uniref:GntR family transcriptional regulator n=1 Tax=Streptomyces olivaceus TaxID=47716 RepID=UPI001CCE1479|nr:GntR family transcriptional regulator [Streptomyces olivaceus]MBZ6204682.1 GntR family transcriptional regulator [Streptomyces olivaceus]MBZ6288870.1 GntR family transcriptional regulator [Streptomyces olivaceus]
MSEKGAGSATGPYGASRLEAEIQAAIDRGDLRPGDQMPTTSELADRYAVNKNTVSRAISALKAAGVLTGPAGGRTWVRVRPQRITRHNVRYHREKERVLLPEHERAQDGVAETDTGMSIRDVYEDTYCYDLVAGPDDVRAIFELPDSEQLLRRTHQRRHAARAGASGSTSYIPYILVNRNPDLLDSDHEPWPGGTMHQLHTVGIELDHIDDRIVVEMPTREEQQLLDIPTGVPLIRLRKVSWSTDGRAVEVSDIPLPADRTELIYTTPLDRW